MKEKGIIQVSTSVISPAVEEAYKFQRKVLWAIGLLLCIIILLVTFTSAMYAGESKNYSLSDLGMTSITDVFILGNVSEIVYYFTNESAIITIPFDAVPQEFTITFNGFKEETPVVVITSSGGGGGHSYRKATVNTTNLTNETLDNIIVTEFDYTPPVEKPVEEVKPIEVIPVVDNTTEETTWIDKILKDKKLMWAGIILGIILVLIGIILLIKRRMREDSDSDNLNNIIDNSFRKIE